MRISKAAILATTALSAFASVAHAQTAPAPTQQSDTPVPQTGDAATQAPPPDIVVVGSQIRGSKVTEALPVSVLDANQIAATGAVSGDELIRSIPQMGDVDFNSANNPQTSNAARGDVNSIDLRNLGAGNTLVLINGRRMVQHPVSQAGIANVPVLTYNSNALPIAGLERLEVLRDGAAAIYGADAVAGVVNVVLKDDYDGLSLNAKYGGAEGTHLREYTTNFLAGRNFGQGRGNITVM
ncbi:MAG: TonB-dependent receptor plug domain-containing protein, partial [Sphingomonas sp.]